MSFLAMKNVDHVSAAEENYIGKNIMHAEAQFESSLSSSSHQGVPAYSLLT